MSALFNCSIEEEKNIKKEAIFNCDILLTAFVCVRKQRNNVDLAICDLSIVLLRNMSQKLESSSL